MTRIAFAILFAGVLAAPAQETKKVVITTQSVPYLRITPEEMDQLSKADARIRLVAPAPERVMEEVADADAIIGPANAATLRAARKLKWLQVTSAGVEGVLTPELKARDVVVTNAKIIQGPEISDHALAMLLALTRGLNVLIPARANEEWRREGYALTELRGRTAVVVGLGGIGTQIAVRANAFGMKVVGVDPKDTPYLPFVEKTVPPDRLDEVLPQADVVFVAAPHTAKSEKMFGPRQFGLMPKGGYFIAVSRGKVYDMPALVSALETKHLAGAGVDVTDPEPLPKGHPLWKMENVIITPHIAGRSDREHPRYIELYKENLKRFANGEPLLHVVDKEQGY